MNDQTLLDRIVVSSEVLHGKPRVAGTRISVIQVLNLLAAGKTALEIVPEDYYPDLTEGDIRACIAYASHVLREDRFIPVPPV